MAVVPGGGQHEEGLCQVSAHQSLQRKPAGAEPQPQTQPPGVDSHVIVFSVLTASVLRISSSMLAHFLDVSREGNHQIRN